MQSGLPVRVLAGVAQRLMAQRRAVQVSAEPDCLSLFCILLMVDSRQRAPGFCRVINIGLPVAVRLLPGV
ncbi:MAG: hypothetical protein PW844_19975 [Pantoea sp.]|uniref:hypothetical protein n=1 Tax=Pantoea sp. TaxID=69393 RepID=UPI00239895C7|nr:hypothetical protein [Pantoea sp.]MDE1188712.1 hypothetical protein [Pantoea sp.]